MVAIKPPVAGYVHLVLLCFFLLSLKDKNATFLEGTGVLYRAQDHLK